MYQPCAVACPLVIAISCLELADLGQAENSKMSGKNWDRVPIDAQSVDAPLSTAAVFLVVTVASETSALAMKDMVRALWQRMEDEGAGGVKQRRAR